MAPAAPAFAVGEKLVLERSDLRSLFEALRAGGFRIVGPTVRDGAVIYDELSSDADLPAGWTDEQDGGHYRLKRRDDAALFGYAVGPHSWKRFLFPPSSRLWSAQRTGASFEISAEDQKQEKLALFGVRACELHAIAIQDRVFMGRYTDPTYAAKRQGLFIVAVNCGTPAGTCFCASMGTGPKADSGFDLALTEMLENGRHSFLLEIGSPAGAEIVAHLPCAAAASADLAAAAAVSAKAEAKMGRTMQVDGLKELLYANFNHPRWDEVAERCLTCANCTMVCPTCFCSTVEDTTDLTGEHAERWRKWDSCFTMDFSYAAGGSVRNSAKSRYRQWMTHKLATWHDQFGTSGCVGCGRCITWCPVGIDLTAEAAAIRQTSTSQPPAPPIWKR
jgi:ferredoxin